MNEVIDAVVPDGVTHIGFIATNFQGDFLIFEPNGHPSGVSATFGKVKRLADESPSQTLNRCISKYIGQVPISTYPIPSVWVTPNSTSFYFAGMLWNEGDLPSKDIHSIQWYSRERAEEHIYTSENPISQQRDLALLQSVTKMCLSPYRRILLMVRELHRLGFERLRAPAYEYPLAWRCPVVPAAWTLREHGGRFEMVAHHLEDFFGARIRYNTYSSASGQQPFGWKDVTFAAPSQLAHRFIKELPEIALAGWGPDPEYVSWFENILEMTKPNGIYYAFSEDRPATASLYTMMTSVERLPLPPPGLSYEFEFEEFHERLTEG